MAVLAVGTPVSLRAEQARAARGARAAALVIDLISTSVLLAIVNNVYGVPGYGAPWALGVFVWLAYVTLPEALFGATLGKMLTGVCVVDAGGAPLTVGKVIIRNLGRIIDALPFLYLLGGVMVQATSRSQRAGDMLAGTTVVARTHATGPSDTRHPPDGARRVLGLAMLAMVAFTVAFNFFGRPPLVVEGAYRSGALQMQSYSLGSAHWSLGAVTYQLSGTKDGVACTGEVYLYWTPGGWETSGWNELCPGAPPPD